MPDLVIIDVGCAIGEFSEYILNNVSDVKIHAFEPNIALFENKLRTLENLYPAQFFFYPYALARFSGREFMYGTSELNGQIGSLKKFNTFKKWDNYLDKHLDKTKFLDQVLVEVKGVRDFLSVWGLTKVDFLKIDAQGSDIDILEEFLLNVNVRCMVVEVNVTSSLYENIYQSENNLTKLSKVLSQFKLEIIKIVPNRDFTEINVFLSKNFEEGLEILHNLKIFANPVFIDGWNIRVVSNVEINRHFSKRIFGYLVNLKCHLLIFFRKIKRFLG